MLSWKIHINLIFLCSSLVHEAFNPEYFFLKWLFSKNISIVFQTDISFQDSFLVVCWDYVLLAFFANWFSFFVLSLWSYHCLTIFVFINLFGPSSWSLSLIFLLWEKKTRGVYSSTIPITLLWGSFSKCNKLGKLFKMFEKKSARGGGVFVMPLLIINPF